MIALKSNLLSIGDMSRISGVHIKSLRYYDEIGVLKPAYVDPDSNYRYYTYQQLGILDAIRACIELDIPLKEFENFTEDNGNIIRYSKLFEQGKKMAKEKIRSIRAGIKNIELFQREVERGLEVQNHTEPIIADVQEKQYYVLPFAGEVEESTYYIAFLSLMHDATQSGYKLGYQMGKLYIYKRNTTEQYNFLEVITPPNTKDKKLITIPAGHCVSKCISASRIQYAADEFPALFALDYDKIVVETELLTENYVVGKPIFELICFLPDKENI